MPVERPQFFRRDLYQGRTPDSPGILHLNSLTYVPGEKSDFSRISIDRFFAEPQETQRKQTSTPNGDLAIKPTQEDPKQRRLRLAQTYERPVYGLVIPETLPARAENQIAQEIPGYVAPTLLIGFSLLYARVMRNNFL